MRDPSFDLKAMLLEGRRDEQSATFSNVCKEEKRQQKRPERKTKGKKDIQPVNGEESPNSSDED